MMALNLPISDWNRKRIMSGPKKEENLPEEEQDCSEQHPAKNN
tara:strand:+ start:1082 stop:1210 length:129 start_codon:yes stop_codon:yes gene_type:complete